MKLKKIIVIVITSMFLLTGCGKKDIVLDEYGNGSAETADEISSADTTGNGSGNSLDNSSESDQESGQDSSDAMGKTLAEKLGGEIIEYHEDFSIGTKSANLDVRYSVRETDRLCEYKVKRIQESDIKEDDIVKNLFGDTGAKLTDSGRDKLDVDNGDSSFIIYSNMYSAFKHNHDIDFSKDGIPSWIDTDEYFLHNYEGEYNHIPYELMLGYSTKYSEMYIAFYPKNISDISGDAELDNFQTTDPNGMIYINKNSTTKDYNIPVVMEDRPNKCTLSDDELMSKVNEMLEDKLNLPYPEEGHSFYANLLDNVGNDKVEPIKCEALFFNQDPVLDETFSGGLRDGYACSLMIKFCNQKVLANAEISDGVYYYSDKKNNMYVNNDGVFAFDMIVNCSFEEMISDDLQLLSFEDAMKAFVEQAQENITEEKAKDIGKLSFRDLDLEYYPVPIEEGLDECTFTPVWVFEARNDRGPVARVLINAKDGSMVELFY